MSFAFDDISCGGQLQVGTGVAPAIGVGNKKINGSAHVEGPMVVGPPNTQSSATATMMIGPLKNSDDDCPSAKHSLHVTGAPPDIDTIDTVYIEGDVTITGALDCHWKKRLASRFATADGKPKLFDIDHPTKGKGHRLAHACIEGPEVGVYYRGRLRNKKVIELPHYWKGLVHTDSISVQLQPIGAHQDIIIKRWDDTKIYLQAKANFPIDCFYHVYGERKDVDGLIVEYEGETWEDHPQRKEGDVTEWEKTSSTAHNTWTQ
tara:strand:+ start:452 stop:1237 length:786 start_codon:yes stop_codon:yes gene_type:complete